MKLTQPQLTQIAGRSTSSLSTVCRAYRGLRTYDTTRARICAAAAELGLPPPPPASEPSTSEAVLPARGF